jgi:hypothetical protein
MAERPEKEDEGRARASVRERKGEGRVGRLTDGPADRWAGTG